MRKFIDMIRFIIADIVDIASFGFIKLAIADKESYDDIPNDSDFWKKSLYEELYKLQANDYKEFDEESETLSIEVLANWLQYLTVEDRREFYTNLDDELRAKFFAYIR
jgi:hypothetical protein